MFYLFASPRFSASRQFTTKMIANPTIRHGSSHPPPFPPLALPLFHSLGTSSRPFALPRCVSVPPFRLEHFSLSSLPSLKWKRHTFRAALEPNSSVGGGAADDGATSTIDKYSVKIPFGSRQVGFFLILWICFFIPFCGLVQDWSRVIWLWLDFVSG